MNRKLVITMVIIASIAMTAGVVKAAGMTADWLRVGTQGEGGVTYFNGTIINETTGDNNADNPVTFGDNVRIDGRVYRGATAGTGDTMPFIVNDNMEVTGTLTVGNVTATGFTGSGIISSDNLASNAVTSAKITDGTIATADLADSAVTGAKIAAESVTQAVEDYSTQSQTTTESGGNYSTAAELEITTGDSTLFCIFSAYLTTDAINQSTRIALLLDGEIIDRTVRRETNGEGEGQVTVSTNALMDVTAGAHTVQLGWNTDAGATATMYANTLDCVELKK